MAKKQSKKVLSGVKPIKLITDEVLGTESIVPITNPVNNDPEFDQYFILEGYDNPPQTLSQYQTQVITNFIKIFAVGVAALICMYLGFKVFS